MCIYDEYGECRILWDEGMSNLAYARIRTTPGTQMIVLVGGDHVRYVRLVTVSAHCFMHESTLTLRYTCTYTRIHMRIHMYSHT